MFGGVIYIHYLCNGALLSPLRNILKRQYKDTIKIVNTQVVYEKRLSYLCNGLREHLERVDSNLPYTLLPP